MEIFRCPWCGSDPLYVRYHDEEWGVPVHDDTRLFEMLTLEGAQAGLSWITVLRKRERYRELFEGFDPARVVRITPRTLAAILADPGIIRNRAKVESTVSNARAVLAVQDEFGSLDGWLWSFVGGRPLRRGRRGLGAGGGGAAAAVLLGRAAGLTVWVTSRDESKAERARNLGAHAAFETGARLPERVDLVLETVGEATWGHSLRAVREGGAIVVSGATTGWNPPAELHRVYFRRLRVLGTTMGTLAELRSLVQTLVATGVRPVVDDTYDLRDGRRAYERLAEGDVFGKLVLTND
jgi:DNA-3-methyladenine glycosylase I